jgi:AGCS family alanine or glycine:cation symporter
MRYGVARGVFSNEAGMGSAAITAAAASTTDPVRQGYINMTGTFWDTIVVCTITGLCVASSGVLGMTDTVSTGLYMTPEWSASNPSITFELTDSDNKTTYTTYDIYDDILTDENVADDKRFLTLISQTDGSYLTLTADLSSSDTSDDYYKVLSGRTWNDTSGNEYVFSDDGTLEYREVVTGAALTIAAFKTILGTPGSRVICIGIVLFAFSSIIGWEYNGEKAFEYLFGTHKYNMIYRTVYSLIVFIGAVTTLQIAWTFSDIANALMIIPNIICLLVMSNVIVKEINRYQNVLKEEKANRK